MTTLLTAAFIVAATQFFKARFSLTDRWALICAFIVTLIVGLAPVAAAALPSVSPWITNIAGIIVLFIGAAGGYDFVMAIRRG